MGDSKIIHIQSLLDPGKIFAPIKITSDDVLCDSMENALSKVHMPATQTSDIESVSNYTGSNTPKGEGLTKELLLQLKWVDIYRSKIQVMVSKYTQDPTNINTLKTIGTLYDHYRSGLLLLLTNGALIKHSITDDNAQNTENITETTAATTPTESLDSVFSKDEESTADFAVDYTFEHLDYQVWIKSEDECYTYNTTIPLSYTHSWEGGYIRHGEIYQEFLIASYNYTVYSLKHLLLLYATLDGEELEAINSKCKLAHTYNVGLWTHNSLTFESLYTDSLQEYDKVRQAVFGNRYPSNDLCGYFTRSACKGPSYIEDIICYRDPETRLDTYRKFILKDPNLYVIHCERLNNILMVGEQLSTTIQMMKAVQNGECFNMEKRETGTIYKQKQFDSSVLSKYVETCVRMPLSEALSKDQNKLFGMILSFAENSLGNKLSIHHLNTLDKVINGFKRTIHTDLMKYTNLLERNQHICQKEVIESGVLKKVGRFVPNLFKMDIIRKETTNVTIDNVFYYQFCCSTSHIKHALTHTTETKVASVNSDRHLKKIFNDIRLKIMTALSKPEVHTTNTHNTTSQTTTSSGMISESSNLFSDIKKELMRNLKIHTVTPREEVLLRLRTTHQSLINIPKTPMAAYCEVNQVYHKLWWFLYLMFYYAFVDWKTKGCEAQLTISVYQNMVEPLIKKTHTLIYGSNSRLSIKAKAQMHYIRDLLVRITEFCEHYNKTLFHSRIPVISELECNPTVLVALPDTTPDLSPLLFVDYYNCYLSALNLTDSSLNMTTLFYKNTKIGLRSYILALSNAKLIQSCIEDHEVSIFVRSRVKHISTETAKSVEDTKVPEDVPSTITTPDIAIESGLGVCVELPNIPFSVAYQSEPILTGSDYTAIINALNAKIVASFSFLHNGAKLPSKRGDPMEPCITVADTDMLSDAIAEDTLKLFTMHLLLNGGLEKMISDTIKNETIQQNEEMSILTGFTNYFNTNFNGNVSGDCNVGQVPTTKGQDISVSNSLVGVLDNLNERHRKQCIEYTLNAIHSSFI